MKLKTDQCVKCGLCLPHCPTFALTRNENHSPRGRITLIEGLLNKEIVPGPNTASALEGCLSCYRCEAVCPAKVPFAEIMEQARAVFAPTKLGFVRWMVHPCWLSCVHRLLWVVDRLGLRRLARKIGLLRLFRLARADELLGAISQRHSFQAYYPPTSLPQGDVSLFLGCLSQISLHSLIHKSIALLQALGYGVYVPTKQTCCGALFLHTGHVKEAQECQQLNKQIFTPPQPLLTFATGCERDLKTFLPESVDIMTFLSTVSWPTEWSWRPLAQTIVIQTPCSSSAKDTAAVYSLLTKIPNIRLETCQDTQCCGAAGIQMLTHPVQSDALGRAWLDKMQKMPHIDAVVTTNIGCQCHLQRLFQENNPFIPCLHPLSVFLGQLNQKEGISPLDKGI